MAEIWTWERAVSVPGWVPGDSLEPLVQLPVAFPPGPQATPSCPLLRVHTAGTQKSEGGRDEVWAPVTDVAHVWGARPTPQPHQRAAHTAGVGPHHVVDEVGEGPDDRHADKGDAEQNDMEKPDGQHIGQPDAAAVHHPRVGVHLTVRRAHVHPAAPLLPLLCKQAAQERQVTPLPCPLTPSKSRGVGGSALPNNSRQFCCFDSQAKRPKKGRVDLTPFISHCRAGINTRSPHTLANRDGAPPGTGTAWVDRSSRAIQPRAKKPLPVLQSHLPEHSHEGPLSTRPRGGEKRPVPSESRNITPAGLSCGGPDMGHLLPLSSPHH